MRVSNVSNRIYGNITDSMNSTTLLKLGLININLVHMNQEIPISFGIKSTAEENEIAERFKLKARVLKDTSSVGGFKMSQENLKKREDFKPDNSAEGYGKTTYNQNRSDASYNNFNSTNYKTNSEQGKFYTPNMNSTSNNLIILINFI